MTARSDRKPICSALLRVIFLLAKMYVESWEMLAAARMTASIRKPQPIANTTGLLSNPRTECPRHRGQFRSRRIAGLLALAAAELKLVNDDAQLVALLVILGPLRVAQLAVDGDLGSLEEVLGQLLGAGAEQGALDEHGASTYSPSAFLRFSLTATVNPATARRWRLRASPRRASGCPR